MAIAKESAFHGIAASPGIAIGTALVLQKTEFNVKKEKIPRENVDLEINRLREAIDKTRIQIQELQNKVQSALTQKDAKIFDAHLLILDDKILMDEIEEVVRRDQVNVAYVFSTTIHRYILAISSIRDQYFRERATDIKDVAERLLKNLHGTEDVFLDHLPGQKIIIAHDLTPSDTAGLDRENAQAFATEVGSSTSHTAIMARSMKIPAVVGIQADILEKIHNGDLLIVDGHSGDIIVNPSRDTLDSYARKETKEQKFYEEILKESTLRPETIDGFRVQLAANIDSPGEVDNAKIYGAAGIGLFRTEYLLLGKSAVPSEEEQFAVYSKLTESMDTESTVIRTFDVGGDKLSSIIPSSHHEMNPFLGCRAIRLFREHKELFLSQIRAILRASALGKVKIMFPMISNVEEVDELLSFVEEAKLQLKAQNIKYDEAIEIGIMIEIPSAALLAKHLAEKVDFFSIGSNDLVQYTMAVDRTNEKVAYLYQPANPAILKLIKDVVDAAKDGKIWVSLCGEMAGDPRYTPFLVGLGIHELSMTPASIGPVRRLIRSIRKHEAEELVVSALKARTAKEALSYSEDLIRKAAPDIMDLAGTK